MLSMVGFALEKTAEVCFSSLFSTLVFSLKTVSWTNKDATTSGRPYIVVHMLRRCIVPLYFFTTG